MGGERRVSCAEEIGPKRLLVGAEEGPELPCVRTGLFGELYAPKRLSELVGLLETYAEAGRNVVAWRGQENICWGIDCTATRRLRTWQPSMAEAADLAGSVDEYEKRLVEEA
jgi:hypothetical protein